MPKRISDRPHHRRLCARTPASHEACRCCTHARTHEETRESSHQSAAQQMSNRVGVEPTEGVDVAAVPWRPCLDAAADLLAGGFFDDPLYTYMCPNDHSRRDPGGKKAMLWALGSSYEMVDILEKDQGRQHACSGGAVGAWQA